ncbi:hypothetical protein GGX14DRAFT_606774 [Mycena pura]|uniref:Uncharacterized protein n=1 Tax=Mycena pura TaxID=153505 RepID=A0AAD6VM51_9AGAR|nr:hypothetical protein GGX14DRAFT_606774 [Mycena pura]
MNKKFPDLYSTQRSFISPASFHIFNRLCDTLLLLVLIYSRFYPDQPFCPWLLMTDFVEHFFGLARMMLPNFTYADFLKIVQHVMVRQRILLSGSFKEKRDRKANQGYVLDFDNTPLTAEDRKLAQLAVTETEMNSLVEVAYQEHALITTSLLHIPALTPTAAKPVKLTRLGSAPPKRTPANRSSEDDSDTEDDEDEETEDVEVPLELTEAANLELAAQDAARYSALCDDYDAAVEEAESAPAAVYEPDKPPPHLPSVPVLAPPAIQSEFIVDGKLSIAMMITARLHCQSGATTKGEKVIRVDSKYALGRIARAACKNDDDDTEPEEMTLQEGSNAVRVLQDLNSATHANKLPTARELRWKTAAKAIQTMVNSSRKFLSLLPNISAKNVHALNPLSVGAYTVMWNGARWYIGEILDVYKRGASSRYGSVRNPTSTSGLAYLSVRVYLALTSTPPAADDEDEESDDNLSDAPTFSHRYKHMELYTHAKIEHLLFNLGGDAFERGSRSGPRTLTPHAALKWMAFARPGGPVEKVVKKLTIKIKPVAKPAP